MHLPDGVLDTRTALLSAGAAAVGVSLALRQVRSLEPRKVPLLGLSAAFLFAAQLLNFPVVAGTSGHIIGGVLAAILLGPAAAVIVLTCVLIVQALMFGDGGVLALGANVFNMAIVGACGGYGIFRLVCRVSGPDRTRATVFAGAFAGWCGTVLAAIACAGQLAMSNTIPWSLAFPAMANIHMVIGVFEGIATALVVLAIMRSRPDLVEGAGNAPAPAKHVLGYALLAAIGLAFFVAPFASPLPDGLETVAHHLGFASRATETTSAPMPDYRFPIVGSATAATAIAGLVGTLIAYVMAYVLARVLVPLVRPAPKNALTDG